MLESTKRIDQGRTKCDPDRGNEADDGEQDAGSESQQKHTWTETEGEDAAGKTGLQSIKSVDGDEESDSNGERD